MRVATAHALEYVTVDENQCPYKEQRLYGKLSAGLIAFMELWAESCFDKFQG